MTVDTLVVEASVKPLINLVWAGVIILLVGFGTTIVRRAGEARRREKRGGGLRSGISDDADAERVHELTAEPGGDPEQREGDSEEEEVRTR